MNEFIWKNRLEQITKKNLLRTMRTMHGLVAPVIKTDDGAKLLFCSNDYLGIAAHPQIAEAATKSVSKWGIGSASSRLVSGNTLLHEKLEIKFAEFLHKESAVFFSSGYQANVGSISTVAQKGDIIFSDRLVHASIIDGCRLSNADAKIYDHLDLAHLDNLLQQYKEHAGVKLIVTDAVFSMDGDKAPVLDICKLAKQHGAFVYLDEAHSLGILGDGGRGLAFEQKALQDVAIIVGTMGKTFGVSGAFVAASNDVIGLIKSKARSLLYSTAPSAILSGALLESIDLVEDAHSLRKRLFENIALFKQLAQNTKIPLMNSETPIQPILIGSTEKTMKISEKLWNLGLFVQGIRPPTVKEGTSRLRVTITAAHNQNHIEQLIKGLLQVL